MRITIGRFIRRKEDYDSENINCPIEDYNRTKFLNRRFIVRLLFILIYGYGFGYMIPYEALTLNEIKASCIELLIFFVISFYLIQIPHEFIHTLFYKNPLKNETNGLIFFNKKRIVTSELIEKSNGFILFLNLITPFLIFTLLPLLLLHYIGFDIYLYALSFASAILSSDDIVNVFLLMFTKSADGLKCLYVIPNNYEYLLATPEEIEEMKAQGNFFINSKVKLQNMLKVIQGKLKKR